MTKREKLQDQYEDALFALLMDDLAWQEGEQLLELNEHLKDDPDADVPEEVVERGRKVINREFTKKNISKAGRTSWNVFKKVAIAACVAVLLFTVAFAASETVRVSTLNLMIEVFDRYTDYRFVESPREEDTAVFSDFAVGWVPEDFTLTERDQHEYSIWEIYEGANERMLRIDLESFYDSAVISVDTEDALVEELQINGYPVTLITKEDFRAMIMFPESKQGLFAVMFPEDVHSEVERDEFLKILENISLRRPKPAPSASDTNRFSGFNVGWVPEGLTMTEQKNRSDYVSTIYEGSQGEYLSIRLYTLGEAGVMGINTEDAVVEDITINDWNASLITTDHFQIVIPFPEKKQIFCASFFTEETPPKKEEFLRIIEGISLYK